MGIQKTNRIFTDGSFYNDTGFGGYAAVPVSDAGEPDPLNAVTGYRSDFPNVQAVELMAVIEGIRAVPKSQPIEVYTDHKAIVEVLSKSARSRCERGVNHRLWNQLRQLVNSRQVALNWVRAHNGVPGNVLADRLARSAVIEGLKACSAKPDTVAG